MMMAGQNTRRRYSNVEKVIHSSVDMSVQNQQEEGREDTFSPEYVEQQLESIKLLERTVEKR